MLSLESSYVHILWAVTDYLNTVSFLPYENQNFCQLDGCMDIISWEWQQSDLVEIRVFFQISVSFPDFSAWLPDGEKFLFISSQNLSCL